MAFLKTLFSTTGLLIGIYILIGVFFNTAPPHIPTTPSALSSLHSWVQYIISVLFWPLALWHPTFTLGQWTPLSFMVMIIDACTHPSDAGRIEYQVARQTLSQGETFHPRYVNSGNWPVPGMSHAGGRIPARTENAAVPGAEHRGPAGARRAAALPENPGHLAVGRVDHRRVAAYRRAPASPVTSPNPTERSRKENPGARGTPATRPASRAAVIPRR